MSDGEMGPRARDFAKRPISELELELDLRCEVGEEERVESMRWGL